MSEKKLSFKEDKHPFFISLDVLDEETDSNIPHKVLIENGNNDVLINHMVPLIKNHHIEPEALIRHKELIESLRILNLPSISIHSPYPKNFTTQKGNFAEIFLAEYLTATSSVELPIYRLRYNPNPDQSMKGDDVLLFDLDTEPVRIIVGESKFRGTPDKSSVMEMIDGLIRSNREGLPISLMFVSEILIKEGKLELGKKVQNCALLFATNKLTIEYVGLLMGNQNAKNPINKHTPNVLRNLLMISLGIRNPEKVIESSFEKLEDSL